jgi:hypothetical protein
MAIGVRVVCCFCGDPIAATGYDPCSLALGTQWARASRISRTELLLCHAECLRKTLRPEERPTLIDPGAFPLEDDGSGVRYSVPGPPRGLNPFPCSFCGKTHFDVKRLIAGPGGVSICNECVDKCNDILDEEGVPPRL